MTLTPETKQFILALSKEGRAWVELALHAGPTLAGFIAGLHLPMPKYMKGPASLIRGLFIKNKSDEAK